MIACTGTGCAYRVPIIYTEAMLDGVRLVMAMATGTFGAENAEWSSRASRRPPCEWSNYSPKSSPHSRAGN